MADLNKIIKSINNTRMDISIDKLCKIKKYITTKEKINFINEYEDLLKKNIEEYPGLEPFVSFVFFNLLVVKKYTDIDIEFTFEYYDLLQENCLIDKIVEFIGTDYMLMIKIIDMINNEQVRNDK